MTGKRGTVLSSKEVIQVLNVDDMAQRASINKLGSKSIKSQPSKIN